MQDILQTFKISDFEIDRDSKISLRFLAACTRFQQVAGPLNFIRLFHRQSFALYGNWPGIAYHSAF